MRKTLRSKLLLIMSASALGMGLVSCNGGIEASSSSDSTSSETSSSSKAANRIMHDEIPYTVVGDEIDLDNYVTIRYEDGTTDKDYSVSCTNKNVEILKHKVLASKAGNYTLVITAGSLTTKMDFYVVSEELKEFIDFLEPLDENPQNYDIMMWTSSSSGSGLVYDEQTYVHNPNYIAIYDETDPGAVYPSTSKYAGQPMSTVLAKLSDKHAYWGYTTGTAANPDVEFEAGYASYDGYYITGDLVLDATDFAEATISVPLTNGSTYEYECLLSSASFEESLMSYGMSITSGSLASNDLGYYGASFEGMVDLDDDDVADAALLGLWLTYVDSAGQTQVGLYSYITISNIGDGGRDFLDKATTDSSYVPVAVEAPEVTTIFDNIAKAKNYTLTTELFSCDSTGEEVAAGSTILPETSGGYKGYPGDALLLTTGATHIKVTSTFTDKGVIATCETNSVTTSTDGWVVGADLALSGKYATWDDGTDTYTANYDSEKKAMGAATKQVEGKTAYESGLLDDLFIGAIGESDVNNTYWISKETEGNTISLTGQAGDNTGTEVTNTLFKKLFDMNGFGLIGSGYSVGDYLTQSEEFNGGEYHALCYATNYDTFTLNTETNEVNIFCLSYWPFGLTNGYVGMKITITNVGSTTNDFSAFTA